MEEELLINNKNAYTTWGITMDSSSLSALMTPPPTKSAVENKSRLEHGKRVEDEDEPKIDERDLTLIINLSAKDEYEFFDRYNSFCNELKKRKLDISTKYQIGVVYKTKYISCSQFTQFMRGIAKFSLKLNEPNPNDRTAE